MEGRVREGGGGGGEMEKPNSGDVWSIS